MSLLGGAARSLYGALLWLSQPLLRRKLARRAIAEPGYAVAVEERFGRYDVPARSGAIWVHAVSLGETRAAALLLAELRRVRPDLRLLLTHGTATGRAEGTRLLQPGDVQVWLPWDTPGAVARFLDHFQPCAGVLLETEVWPNLVAACRSRGVPLMLANARLNEHSLRRARRLGVLARPAYGTLAAVWAQTEDDARRLRQLGAPVCGVFGNLKFDATPPAELLARGRSWRAGFGRPVVLLASSREGEEALLLEQIGAVPSAKRSLSAINNEVAEGFSACQWLIVPRHPQRFDAVAADLAAQTGAVSRRSDWACDGPPAPAPGRGAVWLGDSLGEMPLYYALADVALLGGSFAPLGGQNLIEAAACGCPVILGPHTFNFAEAAQQAIAVGAACRVDDMAQAVSRAQALLADPPALAAMREAAVAFAAAHRGAAARTVSALTAFISPAAR